MISSFSSRFIITLFSETILDLLWFPLWWYSFGLKRNVVRAWISLQRREESLGIRLWLSTLSQPMYGQTDIQSRIISFVFRVGILLARLVMLAVWMVVLVVSLFVYILLPIGIVYGIVIIL